MVRHAVRVYRRRLPGRHDGGAGAGRVVHGSRRHAHRSGRDLRRVVDRRRRPRAGGIPRRIHRAALPDGSDRVRQLHRRHQSDRGPVSRRQPVDRGRRLQRGRAARFGDRAAVRAGAAQGEARRQRADGLHRADRARAVLAAAVALDLPRQGEDGGCLVETGWRDERARAGDQPRTADRQSQGARAVPDSRLFGSDHHLLLDVAAAVPRGPAGECRFWQLASSPRCPTCSA